MPAVDFSATRKEAEKAGLLGSGDYVKLKEGGNRLRLMTHCLPHAGVYKGTKTFKWLCYVVDRTDGKVKPFFMPHAIYKQIEALQMSEDYAFSEVPMPYDLTINAKNAGTKEVEYTLMPARKETPVAAMEYQQLSDLKPLAELQAALRDKDGNTNGNTNDEPAHVRDEDVDHGEPLTDKDIPF
jgi:hypothetical protein